MTASNLIEIRNLSFARGERAIFNGLSMNVKRGKITAIMGPSGTGKTTLLRIIGGQLKPDRGEVLVGGRDVARMSRRQLFEVRREIGMLFQSSALFTDLSVFENVAFPMRVHTALPEDSIRDLVLMKLNAVGLRGARDLRPSQLSGGMSRRVALARAIALDPQLVMYDEPFTGQDPIAMGVLLTLIRGLNEALDITSLLVSHDIHETVSIADQIFIIADGTVVGEGTPAELKDHTSSKVRQFMHGSPDGPVPFHYPADDFVFDVLGQ
ncbi:MAG: ATP-binding cassette domain-containing protein [Pseudomonadales bacterium]|jgi:phospholipid/cholesterol/gamma-HCH transport system ATP-binding protein|nr:ATP-binding cassette domain-containing protein [Pseudomonadales bacterium]MDP6470851.1 ATP-binding cassette domain-containing protein [Pseudomonadales bacterium]MDP6825964.1 ATP-binding cassette domain-containing protein [Pseudomonadales bacterium]MDP6972276.1 ATP-binding cassette domain-containing protein [Pseudomonadales bacterium]|tara:strand:+ start:1132 stop:1932 length:801 start_codon:yes stop_codon:yes gene_type:complete